MRPLNPQQLLAASHVEGPALVLAGAGSGKTLVVSERIAHLLHLGIPASQILALTFTNRAAGEMQQRIYGRSGASILSCTFHSLCARILRESIDVLGYSRQFLILDEEDSEKALRECLGGGKREALRAVRQQISSAKNQLIEPAQMEREDPSFARIYAAYEAKLRECNALDFDDLLFLAVKLFRQHPEILQRYQARWPFILIDEYQDTNAMQYTFIKLLAGARGNVFAVGDPDQSIYSWRGADIQNILNFEKDFPGARIVMLEQNYRSRGTILEAANRLIQNNPTRFEKKLWSQRGPGEKIEILLCEDEKQETLRVVQALLAHHRKEGIPLRECVIFYRTNFQSRAFEDALLAHNVPYLIVGGTSFYQRREVKDLLSLLRVVLSGSDLLSFQRSIHLPKRGFGEVTLSDLYALSQQHHQDIFTTCCRIVEGHLPFALSKRQHAGLQQYVDCILALRAQVSTAPLHKLIAQALHSSGYLEVLKLDPETREERLQNLEELISKAAEWEREASEPSLLSFLEELTLKSGGDEKDASRDAVRMMTLHNGKGLEFTVVCLVGLEEDLLPHINAKRATDSIEEERRLCYVGMTRAKEHLYLSASRSRFLWGGRREMRLSRFIGEIPREFVRIRSGSPVEASKGSLDLSY